jgi:hypothetical protein
MANCDYCGTFYRGGGLKHGRYQFCNGVCRDHGRVLKVLDYVPPAEIDERIATVRNQLCPLCEGSGPLNIYPSYTVYSVIFFTSWKTQTHFCCRACSRKQQISALVTSLLAGWWGVPFGVLLTPIQIVRNVAALISQSDEPTKDLARIVKRDLAEHLASSSSPTQYIQATG